MDRRSLAATALFTVNLIYGINYPVAKGLMPAVLPPSGFVLLRVIGAATLFWCTWAFSPERVRYPDLLRLFFCAVSGVALNQLMFFHGLMRTSPLHASLIMVATPILVLVVSAVLLREPVTPLKIGGIVLGASGALLLVLVRDSGSHGATLTGDLCILVNALSYGVFLVIVKPLLARYRAVTVMAWTFLFGVLLVLPFGAGDVLHVPWSTLSSPDLGAIAFVVVMVTYVAYLLNTWALRWVNPGVAGTFIYLQPVCAVLFGWLFFHYGERLLGHPSAAVDPIGWVHLVCAACIFAGVRLVGLADRSRVE
jgi:drug/metabolite transporter (DMT)-like permease